MSKRTWIAVIALVASLLIAATGTLAYLTDTDSDVNVMTLGNVDIEQHEMKRKDGIAYHATLQEGDLESFTDGIKLYPAYPHIEDYVDAYYAAIPESDGIHWGPYVHDDTAWNGLFYEEKVTGAVDKMIFVENTGDSDAYVRTILAVEAPEGVLIGYGSEQADIILNMNGNYRYTNNTGALSRNMLCEIDINGVHYQVYEFCYREIMKPGEWTRPSLLQVLMTHWADNETMELLGETYEILALSQAVQVENLKDLGAQGALDAAFGKVTEENATKWFSEMEGMPVQTASTAEELAAALAEGGTVVLTNDLVLDADDTITIPAGKNTTLALGGNTITTESDETGSNVNMFDVRGELTVTGGTLELTHTGTNMGWNNSTQLFNVTAGGVLNLEGVTAINNGGSDMGFVVHLNNWGEVTLNVKDSTLKSNYCPVRVFNSGFDMNNVTIGNTTLESAKTMCFWVHNYVADLDATKHPADKVNARLNFDIFGNGNTFVNGTGSPVVRYGFNDAAILFNADGVQVDASGNPV